MLALPFQRGLFRSVALALATVLLAATPGWACPFCVAETRTLTEEISDSSVVVLSELMAPEGFDRLEEVEIDSLLDPETGEADFTVKQVLLGADVIEGIESFSAIYFGKPDFETTYFVRGLGTPLDWTIPLPLSERAEEYVIKLFELPPSGADRLDFFQQFLQDEDPLLSQDAYDEFARAPYQDVIDLAPRMDRQQLLAWVQDPSVSPSRRRLFLTMLGVCGLPEDLPILREMLTSDGRVLSPAAESGVAAALAARGPYAAAMSPETIRFQERQRKLGLDALIACYLTLSAKHDSIDNGLDLIDQRFLSDPSVDYSHVYSALMALRFLAEEQQEMVPLERVLASARLLLKNNDFADQVIPDLARWEDWSLLGRLEQMFEASAAGEGSKYVREPIVTYFDVAAEQPGDVGAQATEALERLEAIDSEAVKRARSLRAFGFLAQARSKPGNDATSDLTAEGESSEKAPFIPIDEAESPSPVADSAAPDAESAQRETTAADAGSAQDSAVAGPSGTLLLVAPLLAAAVCIGLFWMILRGGAA